MNRRTFLKSLVALPIGVAAAVKVAAAPAPKPVPFANPGRPLMQPYQRELIDAMMSGRRVAILKPRHLGFSYWLEQYRNQGLIR